jgi:hypothetical protein
MKHLIVLEDKIDKLNKRIIKTRRIKMRYFDEGDLESYSLISGVESGLIIAMKILKRK